MAGLNLTLLTYVMIDHGTSPTPTPSPSAPRPTGEIVAGLQATWWQVFAAFAIVIGLIAAIQQLAAFLTRLKTAKAERRILEIAAAQLDAEAINKSVRVARADAEKLEQTKIALLAEVHDRIPRQARRIYLENRIEQLAVSIADQARELEYLQAEARALGSTTDGIGVSLSPTVREAIEEPTRRRRSFERTVLLFFAIFVVLLLTPYSLPGLIYNFFRSIYFADLRSAGDTAILLAIDSFVAFLVWTILGKLATRYNPISQAARMHGRTRTWIVLGATIIAVLGFSVGSVSSAQASRVFEFVCTSFCSSAPDDLASPTYSFDQEAANEKQRLRSTAATAFHVGSYAAGLIAFLVVTGSRPPLSRRLK